MVSEACCAILSTHRSFYVIMTIRSLETTIDFFSLLFAHFIVVMIGGSRNFVLCANLLTRAKVLIHILCVRQIKGQETTVIHSCVKIHHKFHPVPITSA